MSRILKLLLLLAIFLALLQAIWISLLSTPQRRIIGEEFITISRYYETSQAWPDYILRLGLLIKILIT